MASGEAQIGRPAPEFTCQEEFYRTFETFQIDDNNLKTSQKALIDGEFKSISLSDYRGKYVVLFFYPLDFTFVCPTEIIAFSEGKSKFLRGKLVVTTI